MINSMHLKKSLVLSAMLGISSSVYADANPSNHHNSLIDRKVMAAEESIRVKPIQKELTRRDKLVPPPTLEERVRSLEQDLVSIGQQLENSLEANAALQQTITDLNARLVEIELGFQIDGNPPNVIVRGDQVNLGGDNGEPILKGQSFLNLYSTHIHTTAPVVGGPTSPPISQGEKSTLSTVVNTQ